VNYSQHEFALKRLSIFFLLSGCLTTAVWAQKEKQRNNTIEVGETMEQYIQENHIEKIEDMVHQFTSTKTFVNYLLEQGHNIDPNTVKLKRNDVAVGQDIDVFVKHFTEHQNFTMLLVPVDIYPLAIYDTLLFAVLEVSDSWLKQNHYRENTEDPEVKNKILAEENHHLLSNHMYQQVMNTTTKNLAEVQIQLHESYISTSSVMVDVKELEKDEREKVLREWGFFKKMLTHDVALNVEINIYIFGHDDMRVVQYTDNGQETFKITPNNIFSRHHFTPE
jgi:hypothetical protein